MKSKKSFVITLSLLSGVALFGCGGGGDTPTPTTKKIVGISISYTEPTKKFYFGETINKSDFTVTAIYNDSTTSTLKEEEFKVYEYGSTQKLEEVKFPYTLSYQGGMDESRIFTFFTSDSEHATSFTNPIYKKYNFEYGDGDMNYFSVHFDTDHVSSGIKVQNRLFYNGSPAQNVTYESNREGVSIDNDGFISYKGTLDKFPNTTISANVDGICVDKYYLHQFEYDVTGMAVDSTDSCIYCDETHSTFEPNSDGRLEIPSIWNDDYITGISSDNNNFSGCIKLTRIELPDSINSIYKNSFNGCTGLENRKIYIPSGVTFIGEGAFNNCGSAKFTFENCEGWHYVNTATLKKDIISSEWLDNDDNATWLLQQENTYLYK